MNVLLAKKLRMTQVFENNEVKPVTILDASSFVVAKNQGDKTILGLGKDNKAGKAKLGIYKDLGYAPSFVKEYSTDGNEFGLETIKAGDKVRVIAISKGKGFAGVVKRYNMQGGPKTHGQSDRNRAIGSVGAKTMSKVFKGHRMAGRMGTDRVTLKGLRVIEVDAEKKLLVLKGSVPGSTNTSVVIEKI